MNMPSPQEYIQPIQATEGQQPLASPDLRFLKAPLVDPWRLPQEAITKITQALRATDGTVWFGVEILDLKKPFHNPDIDPREYLKQLQKQISQIASKGLPSIFSAPVNIYSPNGCGTEKVQSLADYLLPKMQGARTPAMILAGNPIPVIQTYNPTCQRWVRLERQPSWHNFLNLLTSLGAKRIIAFGSQLEISEKPSPVPYDEVRLPEPDYVTAGRQILNQKLLPHREKPVHFLGCVGDVLMAAATHNHLQVEIGYPTRPHLANTRLAALA